MKNNILKASFLAAILIGLIAFVSEADAQTKRRKKTTRPIAAPTQTVPATVSRNDQYIDGNQIVLGELPQQPQTTGDEIVSPQTSSTPEENTTEVNARIKELNERIKLLESNKRNEYDEKQKRLLLNLDILSRAEQRADALRKQLFEMIEKEATIRTRLEQIQFDARPEMIDRSTAFTGSLRPEEIREQRRKSLDAEKRNLESLLTQIQTNRASLEENVQKSDFLVEKIRLKLDKDIDAALVEDKENQ